LYIDKTERTQDHSPDGDYFVAIHSALNL